jgi:hypothetical protein
MVKFRLFRPLYFFLTKVYMKVRHHTHTFLGTHKPFLGCLNFFVRKFCRRVFRLQRKSLGNERWPKLFRGILSATIIFKPLFWSYQVIKFGARVSTDHQNFSPLNLLQKFRNSSECPNKTLTGIQNNDLSSMTSEH